jgi:ribonuclease J
VLRDRRHLAADGLIVCVVAISRQTGLLESTPEVLPKGFVVDAASADALFREAALVVTEVVHGSSIEERTDPGLIHEKIRVELRRFFRRRTERRPLVLPVVMEI